MEASLEEQKELFVLINKAIVHFRELPQSFMTRDHIKTRIDSLDEYWQTFKTKHFELVNMAAVAGIKKEVFSYFKHEMFYLADNTYNTTKGIMVDELEKLDSSNTKTDWKELAMCNEEIFKLIKNVGANVKEQAESPLKTKGFLQARIATLDDYWHKFSTTHFEMLATEKQAHSYFEQEIFIQCEKEYITLKGKLVDMLDKLNHPSSNVDQEADNCSKDEKQPINEPVQFSEKKDEWKSFKDVCGALINDKPTLENIQNIFNQAGHLLKYLKPAEKEDSLKTCKEYSNRREEVHQCLYALTNEKKIQQPTSESIKKLLDNVKDRLCLLEDILDISNWDSILIHILSYKLDEISLRKWETEVKKLPKDELPTLQKFTDFLDALYRSLEKESDDSDDSTSFRIDPNSNFKIKVGNTTTIANNTANHMKPKPFCYNCGKFGHHGHECQYHE